MIIEMDICLDDLKKEEKNFHWEKPNKCLKCNSSLWGHGFSFRYFNSCPNGVFVKRWRCPKCRTIFTCRPSTHWRRYQESFSNIFKALLFRIKELKWPSWVTRQRGGHWLKKLILNANANLLMKESLVETIFLYQSKNLAIFN